MSDFIYNEIIKGMSQLLNKELMYITGRNSVKITQVDERNEKINVIRGEEKINIGFDRFRVVANYLSKGALVDINDALGSGGNDRSAIETIISHLPHVGYYKGNTPYNLSPQKKIGWFENEIHPIGELSDASQIIFVPLKSNLHAVFSLPKPFLLLAGISGTGKTRFVREQAKVHNNGDLSNYCLIPVRPDWHEPSDLLGYISRIGQNGTHYVVTELLSFIIKSWQDAFQSATETELICKDPIQMIPYWLCLDEMNLAPVEQYFADYLSVLETRKWQDSVYSCDALLKPAIINQLNENGLKILREELKLNDVKYDGLWAYFVKQGIPLPPNLIVAGTVNMDETTHGFSRKVIDRAFTIDFGVFYPNNFDSFFEPKTQAKTLGFPLLTQVSESDLSDVIADSDGQESINFLTELNSILKDTPFELAYRALNELLLAVVSFNPKDEVELQAVWDDFLMSKVLPRIDGDSDKLKANGDDSSLLTKLSDEVTKKFNNILNKKRPDLFQTKTDGSIHEVDCRSIKKLAWMQSRLESNGFTSFWP